MTTNIPYFGDKLDFISRRGYKTHIFSNDQLIVTNCGSYFTLNHSIDIYPVFQNGLSAPIDIFGDFSLQYQTWYDPYSNGYDQGW